MERRDNIGKVCLTIMYWTNKTTSLLRVVMDRPCREPTFLCQLHKPDVNEYLLRQHKKSVFPTLSRV